MSDSAKRSIRAGLRWTSLRLRLLVVFALVALTAAVSASGIAYWLNREAVLTRTQDAALGDFRRQMQNRAASLPQQPTADELRDTAEQMASSSPGYHVLLIGTHDGKPVTGASDIDSFTKLDVPASLQKQVNKRQPLTSSNTYEYHLFWQRVTLGNTPYLVAGTKIIGGGPAGYMLKSLEQEREDLSSLAWSLGIATALALVGSALLAQAAATTVLRPVQRLGDAARKLGEGKLDTRLAVSGTDELADLSHTFNKAASSLEKKVADMSAREESSRRFVADMSHELRTPLTAITAVAEVLEDEADSLDPMIAPAVHLVVSETRRLNDLVENLMEVTRFDSRHGRLVLDTVDVADQVTACIDARAWLDAVDLDAERGIMVRLDPQPARRDPGQSDRQRPQARRFTGAGVRTDRRGRAGHRGPRPRPGNPRGRPAPRVRPLLQGECLPSPLRGQRSRPVHRGGERAHPRRRHHGLQPAGRRGRDVRPAAPRDAEALTGAPEDDDPDRNERGDAK